VARFIVWCWLCLSREENGPGAGACARCQVDIEDALRRLEEGLDGE
jgi:hypothetical protein